ncbi:MAG: hypothetical protein GY925_12970 [Actinomycetia bacterium]|nr:hypothetical protein [Actinomycetes bacterium]
MGIESPERNPVTFTTRDDGQVDAHLGGDWPIFNHALGDCISSLPPRGAGGNGPSTYWVDVAANALGRCLASGTDGMISAGNATSLYLQNGWVHTRNDYGDPDESEHLGIDDFLDLLHEWRNRIREQVSHSTTPLPDTYRRNETAPITGPTRQEVEEKWRDLIAGSRSRAETAAWARLWAWAPMKVEAEVLVMSALQHLDGFDMTRDPTDRNLVRHGGHIDGRPYLHSDQHIAEELTGWLSGLDEHDRDPDGFFERIRERARRHRNG